jgi:hypothetical protein
MPAVNDTATLYDAQIAVEMPDRLMKMMDLSGADYAMGPLDCLYSELAAHAGSGAAGDTIQFMRLPPGTLIVGGWLYWEDGLGADDNDAADLGIIYEDGDGTDNADCLADGIDIYDGEAATGGALEALPTGSWYPLGSDFEVFPYKVTGGWGTVTLTSVTDAFITNKDVKVILYCILPA